MDYSKFYHDWLRLDLVQGEAPNYYQILGLRNMEPDVRKIEDAFRNTLDRLQSVNGMTNPEAYTVIIRRVLEAHKVFIDPNQKHDYDLQLSDSTGERVWKGYERPSFLTRLRQMSLIAFGFILGLGVMVVMALSVDRNPDGSIIFHEEAQARKAPPFSSQLNYVVYRPSIADDYEREGYKAAVNKQNIKSKSPLNTHSSEIAESKAKTKKMPLSELNASLESQNAQKTDMQEISQILSSDIVPSASTETPKVSRRSSLYRKTVAANKVTLTEETENSDQEKLLDEVVKDETDTENIEVTAVGSQKQQTLLPLTTWIEILENIRSEMDLDKPGANESYVLLQYQTIMKAIQQQTQTEGALDSEEIDTFTEYALKVAKYLSKEKHFKEAYELCDTMQDFCQKREAPELDKMVTQSRTKIQNYQGVYNKTQDILKRLKETPEDPKLNMQYAVWIWQDTGKIEGSLPYLVHCTHDKLRKVAASEMYLTQNEAVNTPEATLQVADYWWSITDNLPKQYAPLIKEHAKSLYLKVDSSLLSPDQRERIASL